MEYDEMRKKFNEAIASLISTKRDDNKAFLSLDEYNGRIADVKRSKIVLQTAGSKKSTKDYRMVRKYDVLTIDERERLIKPVTDNSKQILYYVTNEELFDILHSAHSAIGHGGRNRMASEIKSKYCNITKESIMVYLRLCTQCQKKSSTTKRSSTSKPILHFAFSCRARVDLIDMQSQCCNSFQFVMVYHDDSTKFVVLRALQSTRAEEVALNLLEIFTTFGAPVVLYSNNGEDFVKSVLGELHILWRNVKIVYGKSEWGQGLVERVNGDVVELLAAWMAENKSADWPLGIKFVQFQKNCTWHSVIGKSPFEAMFGYSARLGLASAGVPEDEIDNLSTERDVKEFVQQLQNNQMMVLDEGESEEDQENELSIKDEIFVESVKMSTDFNIREIYTNSETQNVATCKVCFVSLPLGKDVNDAGYCLNCEQQRNTNSKRKKMRKFSEQVHKTMKMPKGVSKINKANVELNCVFLQDTAKTIEDDLHSFDKENDVLNQEYLQSQLNSTVNESPIVEGRDSSLEETMKVFIKQEPNTNVEFLEEESGPGTSNPSHYFMAKEEPDGESPRANCNPTC